ncbi:MAG TPA: DUF1254 domain-containing protein [Hyphomicrobiaceae bacterium]|nr:DUF1254 domain-containing protein [Hyphomicrobiaceae bacterium]
MPGLPRWLKEASWRTLLAAALLGGVIHIAATMAVPFVSAGHALSRLRDALPVNSMVVLPPAAPGKQLLPFLAPDALYAMCRYDISVDSLVVTAPMAQAGWTLSLHTPQGDNFYVMPGQEGRQGDITLTVVPSAERLGEFVFTPRRISPTDTNVPSPSWQGLVVIRAPLRGLAWRPETEAALQRATCRPIKRN